MLRVLFVDDERSVLGALERMLRPHRDGWSVKFAQGAVEALAQMERPRVDVVVTDMRMPGMDGAALLDIVRMHHPETIRVVLSGESETEIASRVGLLAHRLLRKPCGPDEIIDALDRTAASATTNGRSA
jgi:DNA-binding NtrC family response regulator